VRYNRKVRSGRGFTLEELKAAGLPKKYARTIGIAVDHRRQNRSVEGFEANVTRLKEYKAKLIVFPRKAGKPKAGEASAEEIAAVQQQLSVAAAFPITGGPAVVGERAITEEDKKVNAYRTLRIARSDAKLVGVREKRAREKAEAEAEKKK
jgi:large subunit ribosomal protein L13e